jgi:hypothetical protein
MGKAGRPTHLNDEVQRIICEALANGNFRSVAAASAGVPLRTFHEWMKKGEEETDERCIQFRRAVIQAEKNAEIRAVQMIMAKAAEDPKHAQWWLAHRFPERWAERYRGRIEHTGKNGGPIQVTDARDKLIEKLSSVLAGNTTDTDESEEDSGSPH